jgi:hypothetical protein
VYKRQVSNQAEGSSVSESAGNQTQGSTTSVSDSAGDNVDEEESRVANINNTRELAFAVGEVVSADNYAKGLADGTWEIPKLFPTPENPQGIRPAYTWEAAAERALSNGGDATAIRKSIIENGSLDVRANELNTKVFGNEATPIIDVDENGDHFVNVNQFNNLEDALVPIQRAEMKELAKQESALADYNEVQEFFYDMSTGVRGMTNAFAGVYGELTGNQGIVEQQQYDNYINSFRTQASYINDELTEEEISRGISGNIKRGNFDAAAALLGTAIAQTIPQLAMQVGITVGTAGLGTGVALTAGAVAMGVSAGGATLIDNYGMMSDGKRYAMSLGDAAVEIISERLFTGDMLAVLKNSSLKGLTTKQLKSVLFKKGIMSEEFLRLAKFAAKDGGKAFLRQGKEEAMEEFIASVGSQFVHGVLNGEEFSMSEAIDGAIVGFGLGGGISAQKTTRQLLSMSTSAMGFAGLRNNIVQISSARQKLATELRQASTETQKLAIEAKLSELKVMEAALTEEQLQVYDEYTNEDAEATLAANRVLTDNSQKLKTEGITPEQSSELKAEMKVAIDVIKSTEAKYEPNRQAILTEREAIKNFEYGETGSLELDGESDTQGSSLVQSIINVAKSLGGNKVTVHRDYDAMSEVTGIDKQELAGSRGIYKDGDGSIHVLLPAAMSNTGFHEGLHAVAADVDPEYMAKFVKAAMPSLSTLDGELKNKYQRILDKHKDNAKLAVEELFVELNADIAAGTIGIDNIGTSLASAAATALNSAFRKTMPFLKLRANPSFASFAEYVGKVTEQLRTGEAVSESVAKKPVEKKKSVKKTEGEKDNFKANEADGVSIEAIVEKAVSVVEESINDYTDGKSDVGFSVRASDMNEPNKGYAVSVVGLETTIPMSELMAMTKEERAEVVRKIVESIHAEAPSVNNGHIGGWVDEGNFVFDLSEVYESKDIALYLGEVRNQDGIYSITPNEDNPYGFTIYRKDFNQGDIKQGETEKEGVARINESNKSKKQANLFDSIIDMIGRGMSKAEIINSMTDSGVTKKDAEMIWNKSLGYKKGTADGYVAGRKQRSEEFKKELREAREKEKEVSKAVREKFEALLGRENLTMKTVMTALYAVVKEYKGVTIKLSQMMTVARVISMAHKRAKKSLNIGHSVAILNATVDKIVDILEKQSTVEQVKAQMETIKKARAVQLRLSRRLKKLSGTSKDALIAYRNQINNLGSIEPAFLSRESAALLLEGLMSLETSVKRITTKKDKDGETRLSGPVLFNEETGEYTSLRESRIYFDELFAVLNHEAMQTKEQQLIRKAIDKSKNDDISWEEAYREVLLSDSEKDIKRYEKNLKAVAKQHNLDINTLAGLEEALAIINSSKEFNKAKDKKVIIDDKVLPTIMKHMNVLGMSAPFVRMLNLTDMSSPEAMEDMIRDRLNKLSTIQLQRIEFMLYNYIANGSTFGIESLAAEVFAKVDGEERLRKLNMKASDTSAKRGGGFRNYVFSWLETTPTFFRRLFQNYSDKRVTDYMSAIGFSDLRSHTQMADARAALGMERILEVVKKNGMNNPKSETLLQIYSMLMQKPEGLSDTEWLLAVREQFTSAVANDKRFKKEVMESKSEAISETFDKAGDGLESVIAQLESIDGLVETHDFMVAHFQNQSGPLQDYAENFLGQEFSSEANYLPFSFIKSSDKTENLSKAMDDATDVRGALDSYNKTKVEGKPSSLFERNPDAIKTKGRFINMNFLSTIEKTNRDNEVKILTSADIAYISEMTSESSVEFTKSIPQEELRHQVRQKLYDYMVDQQGGLGEDFFTSSPGAKRFVNKMRNVTVLYYFGSVIDQVLKQSAPMWNTLMETKNIDSKLEALNSAVRFIGQGIGLIEESDADIARKKVIASFDIQNRNVQEATIGFGGDRNASGEKSIFERGVEISTTGLRVTDRVTATASWLAYYKDYLYENEGISPSEFSWETAAKSPNKKAGDWASAMVAKDQNISTGRDRAKFGRYTRGTTMGLVKLFVIPFIDFLMNKKLNMVLDVQKSIKGGEISKDAARSLAGTTLEIAHFQTMTWFVVAPIIQALASSVFGGEDEEERSWFDKKFNWDMWRKGMVTDINPLVMPVKFLEDGFTTLANMITYTFSEDREILDKISGEGFLSGFKEWEKTNGIPVFGGTPRGDVTFMQKVFNSMGVVGSIGTQYSLAVKNIATLSKDVPYYTTPYGSQKFLTEADSDKMLFMETAKLIVMTIGFGTGIMAKEVNATIKAGERGVGKRAASSKDKGIENLVAERLINEEEGATDILFDELSKRVEMNPATAEAWVKSRKTGFLKRMKSELTKNVKFIATARDIEKRYRSAQQKAYIIRNIAEEMPVEDRAAFINYMYVYFTINGSKGTASDIKIAEKLMYGDSELEK